MEFRVLGPIQVIGGSGSRLDLVSDAQRRLVSYLVLRANTIVRAECLADHLGLTPGALRTSVSRLRRLVGFDTLVTAPPGYELRTDEIDATSFERLLDRAHRASPADATATLRAALDLWRGEPYAEFAHEPWARAEALRLDELRSAAIEDLAALEVDDGSCAGAIARLEAHVAEHPLRERPRQILMQALARSGRSTEALREFEAFRRLLSDETGTRPSDALVALDRHIATSNGTATSTTAEEIEVVERWAHDHGFALVPVGRAPAAGRGS